MKTLSWFVVCSWSLLGYLPVMIAQTADTIYHSGSILTMAGSEPTYVEALVVKDGKISLAGTKDDALKMRGDATNVVDLEGKAVLSGFFDANSPCIPKGEIIRGYGHDDTVMPEGRLLNRDDLDEAIPENPIRIDHNSMHGAVINSLALQKNCISAATKPTCGLRYRSQIGH